MMAPAPPTVVGVAPLPGSPGKATAALKELRGLKSMVYAAQKEAFGVRCELSDKEAATERENERLCFRFGAMLWRRRALRNHYQDWRHAAVLPPSPRVPVQPGDSIALTGGGNDRVLLVDAWRSWCGMIGEAMAIEAGIKHRHDKATASILATWRRGCNRHRHWATATQNRMRSRTCRGFHRWAAWVEIERSRGEAEETWLAFERQELMSRVHVGVRILEAHPVFHTQTRQAYAFGWWSSLTVTAAAQRRRAICLYHERRYRVLHRESFGEWKAAVTEAKSQQALDQDWRRWVSGVLRVDEKPAEVAVVQPDSQPSAGVLEWKRAPEWKSEPPRPEPMMTPRTAGGGGLLAAATMSPAARVGQINASLKLVAEKAKMAETHHIATGERMSQPEAKSALKHRNGTLVAQGIAARLA